MITGLEFVEKLYSEGSNVYLIQREFGIKSYIANKLRLSIDSSKIKRMKLDKLGEELDKSVPQNNFLKRKLIREAIDSKAAVVNSKHNQVRNISNREYKDDLIKKIKESNSSSREKKKLINLINNRDSLLEFDNSKGGNASLAHEIGHIKAENDKITGGFHRMTRKLRNEFSNSSDPNKSEGYFEDGSSSIIKGISRYFKGKAIIENERNASKRAIKLLKSNGASEEEISKAKDIFKNSLDSYKEDANAYWKVPIRNKLEGKKPKIIDKTIKPKQPSPTSISKVNRTKERLEIKKKLEERRKNLLKDNK